MKWNLKGEGMGRFLESRRSRREVLQGSGVLTASGVLSAIAPGLLSVPQRAEAQASDDAAGRPEAENIFTKIGVRPILNARGTYTIISGSRSLPEVKAAMMEASKYFVQMDELMAAVGKEIAELLGAEAAIVTNGCEAAIALATVACMAGTDPEKTQAFPYVKARPEVIIPKHSRNPYDFGVRMSAAEVVEVDSEAELREKITAKTAMIYILSSPAAEKGPLGIPNICVIAREKGVPVFVDAAAEEPLVPNIHLGHGATLVGYSGGKCMRGPQAAGLLLGQRDLVQAAWFNAAPHHNWGRALKVGKEETMGMLTAVRMWPKRDHAAEQREWRAWLKHIEARLTGIPSVQMEYVEAEDLSNRSPVLAIHWDANKVGITGKELVEVLDKGTPRILVMGGSGQRPEKMESSISVMPYMMAAGEEKIVADAIYGAMTKPAKYENPVIPAGEPGKVAGGWVVTIAYLRGDGEQKFELRQQGGEVAGTQHGAISKAELKGRVRGDHVELSSEMAVPGNSISWEFTGVVNGGRMQGDVRMGEYGRATWSAVRA